MKRPLALVATMLVLWSALAVAAPHRVMVLPIDGNADPALRKQLGGVVMQLAKTGGGTVTAGDTTFAEVAAAVGCDPHTPACADTVLSTLGVDEIVYGSASVGGGQTTAVISRVAKGQARRDQTVSISANSAGSAVAKADSAEPTLRPLFDLSGPPPPPEPAAGSGSDAGSAAPVAVAVTTPNPSPGDSLFATRERKLGYGFVAGGALVLVIGLALWASEGSQQSQIDNAPINSPDDVKKLLALEDRASTYAWEGNVAVVLGLVAGGIGTYYLVQDHQMRATVTPIDHGTGAAVLLGGRW